MYNGMTFSVDGQGIEAMNRPIDCRLRQAHEGSTILFVHRMLATLSSFVSE